MRTRLVVAAVVIALATTSCSTSRVAKSSTGATATVTTLAGPPVTEPATTSSTFGPPLIITAPPTTTTPKQALEAEIRAAVQRISLAYRACVHEPSGCQPTSFAAEPYLSFLRVYVDGTLIALGRHVDGNPTDPTYSIVGTVVVAPDGQSAEYDLCTWDTGLTVQALPDTEPVVLDDLKGTSRRHETVQIVDGEWRLIDTVQSAPTVIGRNECGPRP
jgi:hypothetical protein